MTQSEVLATMEYDDFNGTSNESEGALTNNTANTYEFYQTEQLIFLCILFGMILVGNTLVLIAIAVSGKRRSRMNFFIINLACADLSVGFLLVLTDIIWKGTIAWYAGNIACKLVKFSQCTACYGATYSLVSLSIDRLDAIARPMNMADTAKRCRTLVALAWSFAVLFSLPILYIYEEKMVDGLPQCWLELPSDLMWQLYFSFVTLAVFVIPAIIIATCYIVIVCIIWNKSSLKIKGSHSSGCSKTKKCYSYNGTLTVRFTGENKTSQSLSASSSRGVIPKAKIKTIKMTFVIVLAFIFCWSPYFIFDLLAVYRQIKNNSQTFVSVSTFIQSLAPLNSAANPLIYTLFNAAMCKRIFRKQKQPMFNSPPTSQAFTTTTNNFV